jgi:Phosphotransferase enzyme family
MSELRAVDVQAITARAEDALSRVSGGRVWLDELAILSDDDRRNFIARARARYADGATKSVILKATRSPTYDHTAENLLQTSGFAKEWVASALLTACAPGRRHGAYLLAGDVAGGVMIFEDLGAGLSSLVHPLLNGTAEEAEHALKRYAVALGRLHSDTAGCGDAHHEMLQSIFGNGRPRNQLRRPIEKDVEVISGKIGGTVPISEMELLSSRLIDPGPWSTLVHGDPCPDNSLLVDDTIRLIDYEFAKPSHALLDGAYWRIGFPTCWCAGRIPADVVDRVEAIYRAELGRSIPMAIDDTAYRVELTYMSAVWLLNSLSWRLEQALNSDEKWGIWSIRGRLLWYLDVAIQLTANADVLPGIKDTAQMWLSELRRRWPDAEPLGSYPAFASKPV